MQRVTNDRCIICGYRKLPMETLTERQPLCSWCNNPNFKRMIRAFVDIVDENVTAASYIDCDPKSNAVFSFVADLGTLGLEHPFLITFREVLGKLTSQVSRQSRISTQQLLQIARFRYFMKPIIFLGRLGIVNIILDNQKNFVGIDIPPDSIIRKISASIESNPSESNKLRASRFLLGYIFLKAIDLTLSLIEQQKGVLNVGEGITILYERGILKDFTAPIALVFGMWAIGSKAYFPAFPERKVRDFLCQRELAGRKIERVVNRITSDQPGCENCLLEKLEETINQYGDREYLFEFRASYVRERERVYDRARERER
jgi:hypothetical protein